MPAIKATNSKNLTVSNCRFYGFKTDIELESVDGFLSENNQFSQDDPRIVLKNLSEEISKSGMDDCSKQRLSKEIIEVLSSKNTDKNKNKIIKSLKYIGQRAVDFFIQLSAAVVAGLIIRP